MMDSLVSFTQTAFIQGRNMYDNWTLASEVVGLNEEKQKWYHLLIGF